jgi:hypothetical protein
VMDIKSMFSVFPTSLCPPPLESGGSAILDTKLDMVGLGGLHFIPGGPTLCWEISGSYTQSSAGEMFGVTGWWAGVQECPGLLGWGPGMPRVRLPVGTASR